MHSKEFQQEVVKFYNENGISKTYEKYNYIGKSSIRRWINPELKEREAKQSLENFRKKWNESDEFKEKERERMRNQLKDPKFKAKFNEYHKQYVQENKDKIAEYKKKYYKENKEKIDEQNKQWYENNKEDIKFYRSLNYLKYKEIPKNDK